MKLVKIKPYLIIGALYLSFPLLLMFTNPENLPLPLLMLPMLLLFVAFLATVLLVLKRIKPEMNRSKRRIIAVLFAVLPTLLIILQSIQQLSARDVIIVFGLWTLLGWYMLRIDFA